MANRASTRLASNSDTDFAYVFQTIFKVPKSDATLYGRVTDGRVGGTLTNADLRNGPGQLALNFVHGTNPVSESILASSYVTRYLK
jgi:hypothetical protein